MFVIVRKRSLQLILVFLVTIVLFGTILGASVTEVLANKRALPIYAVERTDNKIAISFDAAWGADKTKKIVDKLNKFGVKATFFLVGFWIDKYPDEVKYIYNNGMEIGNHSMSHPKMSKISKDSIHKELAGVNTKIQQLVGVTPKVFRPPFGDYNNTLIDEVNAMGMMPIQWSVDSLDWKGLSSGELSKRVIDRTKSGSIILCHNNSDHILEALPEIILTLKNKGYEFVTMSELVYEKDYKIDANGVQHQSKMEVK